MGKYTEAELVTIEVKQYGIGIGPCPLQWKCLLNGLIISTNDLSRGHMLNDGIGRVEMMREKVLCSIFKMVSDYNRTIEIFVPKRSLEFMNKAVWHRGHRERLIEKFLSQINNERQDYSVKESLEAPKSFEKLLNGATEQYQKTGGCFDTSWYRMLRQISSFGDVQVVRGYTTEISCSDSRWNQHYDSKIEYFIRLKSKCGISKTVSPSINVGDITDACYSARFGQFFLKTKDGGWRRF